MTEGEGLPQDDRGRRTPSGWQRAKDSLRMTEERLPHPDPLKLRGREVKSKVKDSPPVILFPPTCHSDPDPEPKARGKGEESYVLLATEIAMRILL